MNATATPQVDESKVDDSLVNKEFAFRFKKDKLGNQRPSVKFSVPVPTVNGLVDILNSGDKKQYELVLDAMYDVVREVLASHVAEKEDLTQETLDFSKLTWAAIANMPKEDRRSSSIPEELWTGFVADYIEVMPALTGKTKDQVANATQVFVKKFAPWKSQKGIISKLKEQLALYTSTPNAEQFSEIIELLVRRADAYLAADDLTAIAGNL